MLQGIAARLATASASFAMSAAGRRKHLAHQADVDRTYVSGIERGTRNVGIDNIYKIARAFEVDVRDLF